MEVVRRDGSGASMEAMATAAGVTKPILYRHFGDRDGLVDRPRRAVRHRARRSAQRGARRRRATLRSCCGPASTPMCRSSSPTGRCTGSSCSPRPPARRSPTLAHQIGRRVAALLGDQLKAAGRDTGAAEPWAYGIVGMVHLGRRLVGRPPDHVPPAAGRLPHRPAVARPGRGARPASPEVGGGGHTAGLCRMSRATSLWASGSQVLLSVTVQGSSSRGDLP